MLYQICNPECEEYFKEITEKIRYALWPESVYRDHIHSMLEPTLPVVDDKIWPEENIVATKRSLENISDFVCKGSSLYCGFVLKEKKCTERHWEKLPFLDRYHKYFLARKWAVPIFDQHESIDDFLCLQRRRKGNYSKNWGDYNHFVNVVMATARLIQHFSHEDSITALVATNNGAVSKTLKNIVSTVLFKEIPSKRTLRLLIAAFYHDVGKTVVYHRHGMEGSNILATNTTPFLYYINLISSIYNEQKFTREDVYFLSDIISYHDQFGTLATGEAGYCRFVEVVSRLSCQSAAADPENRRIDNIRDTFDLWLLNLADLMVSIERKWDDQSDWWGTKIDAESKIGDFFCKEKPKISNLLHDLSLMVRLVIDNSEHRHTDDLRNLKATAVGYANRHTVERLKRLVVSMLSGESRIAVLKNNYPSIEGMLDCLEAFPDGTWEAIIVRAIASMSNLESFSERFAWIGQMDYALGFFRMITERALWQVNGEYSKIRGRTGWLYSEGEENFSNEFIDQANAYSFARNYVSTIVQIIEHILFREKNINEIRNLEFIDTRKRLTNEKIDQIISIEGPFRSNRSVELILKNIFIY